MANSGRLDIPEDSPARAGPAVKRAAGLLAWLGLSAGYWYLFATAILPLGGREGGDQHILLFALALAVWLLLSGLLAWLFRARPRSDVAG